ncbi:MAG: DNA-3-methyladenine glycosylase [Spirochaetota bacterium]
MQTLTSEFFDRDPSAVAVSLLGTRIIRRYGGELLCARIIETESYYIKDKGSHASLGRTHKREALFMEPGTVYMYYAHGGDSMNISCRGEGNAVLIKSGVPCPESGGALEAMRRLNPMPDGSIRSDHRLCSGQTLLCRALALRVPELDKRLLPMDEVYLAADERCMRDEIVQTTRLGIPKGRDEDLWQRFILKDHVRSATRNPLGTRKKTPCTVFVRSPDTRDIHGLRWDRTAAGR